LEHADDLLESPLPDVPGSPDLEVRVLLLGHRAEQQQDLGARRRLHPLVDRSSQKLLIRQVRPLGAARPDAVEHELERIEYRRLPRAVDPAEEHKRPVRPRRFRRSKIEYLPTLEEPKVTEGKLLENHGSASFSRGPKRPAGDHAREGIGSDGVFFNPTAAP